MTNVMPFGIEYVVKVAGVKLINTNEGYRMDCPFCEKLGYSPDTNGKYYINTAKNVGHCVRCNSSHNIISLHQALLGGNLSREEARNDLYKRWNGLPIQTKIDIANANAKRQEALDNKLIPAGASTLDKVYRTLLSRLELADKHREDLHSRGLTDEEIEQGMYKSVPLTGFSTFGAAISSKELRDELKRHPKWGIPGLYNIRTFSPMLIKTAPGYFVPVKDRNGYITGMQIRFDPLPDNANEYQQKHYAKYKWYSSDYEELEDGCSVSGANNIHFTYTGEAEQVILTEGVLKADVASRLYQRLKQSDKPVPFIGLVGVNNTSQLEETLKYMTLKGLKKIWIAIDMDYRDKPQVAKALENIKAIIEKSNVEYGVWEWDGAKGIDDHLLNMLNSKN